MGPLTPRARRNAHATARALLPARCRGPRNSRAGSGPRKNLEGLVRQRAGPCAGIPSHHKDGVKNDTQPKRRSGQRPHAVDSLLSSSGTKSALLLPTPVTTSSVHSFLHGFDVLLLIAADFAFKFKRLPLRCGAFCTSIKSVLTGQLRSPEVRFRSSFRSFRNDSNHSSASLPRLKLGRPAAGRDERNR